VRSGAFVITTEAVCWEWLNAMSDLSTRSIAARGHERIQNDARIEVIGHSEGLSNAAVRLFTDRSDKDWSLTDCLSFIVMDRRNIRDALTADRHFGQAGLRAVLSDNPPGV
jgi:predicted nucleic acid-binding protein